MITTQYNHLIQDAMSEDITRYVIGAFIADQGKILIVRRKADDKFLPGVYEIPGGKVEANETLEEAVRRETLEETGLTIDHIVKYVGYFDYLSRNQNKTRQFNFLVKVASPSTITLTEHDDYQWVNGQNLKGYAITELMLKCIEDFFDRHQE